MKKILSFLLVSLIAATSFAGSKSDYAENKVLQHIFKSDWSAPTTFYVALFTAAPSDSGGGTEVSGSNYARVSVARNTGWSLSGSSISNAAAVEFPEATGAWGTVTSFGIFDASSGGNLIYWGSLTSSKAIDYGVVFSFPAGFLTLTED